MAAPMDTPRKFNHMGFCVSCGSDKRRLHVFSHNKAIKERYKETFEEFLSVVVDRNNVSSIEMCEVCNKKMVSYLSFRKEAMDRYNDRMKKGKRLAKTPPSKLKNSVADYVKNSVEKLKTLSIDKTIKNNSVADNLKNSIEKLKTLSIDKTIRKSAEPEPKVKRCLIPCVDNDNENDDNIESCLLTGNLHVSMSDHDYNRPFSSTGSSVFTTSTTCMPSNADHEYHLNSNMSKDGNQVTSTCNDEVLTALKNVSIKNPTMQEDQDQLLCLERQLKDLCVPGKSVLWQRKPDSLMHDNCFAKAVNEMESKCPFLFKVLTICLGDKMTLETKVVTIATIYAMIMHGRNKQMSAIQRIYTALAIQFHADNKLLERLNKVHITLSHESKRHLLESFSDYCFDQIIIHCMEGRDGKLNGDNLDLYVKTNDIRMDNKNRDYHYFASDFTFDRAQFNHLDDSAPVGDPNNINYNLFVPSAEEMKLYRKTLKYLIGRQLSENIEGFEWMNSIIPTHIPHNMEKVMSEKSAMFWLPLQMKNEMYHDQCIEIMDEFEKHINTIYSKAGRGGDLDKLKIPVGGDQLTRVNLQSAINLKRGCHTQTERLEHLHPVIVEMFHTLMDFLEKLYKRFFNTKTCRDPVTLANLKMHIQRTNVNGQVKSRFEAHEDFILLVGKAYLLTLVMKLFQMESMDDTPKHVLIKKNMKYLQNQKKEQIFDSLMDQVLDCSLIPFQFDDDRKEVDMQVTIVSTGQILNVTSRVEDGKVTFQLCINNVTYLVSAPLENTKTGCRISFPTQNGMINLIIKYCPKINQADDINNYVKNFMQWYFIILNFNDTIREGDIYRTNILLKQMIPFFYSHSALSKYFCECVDYILKTEVMLSPRLSLRVRLASYVNPKGGKGRNKAADMQKENQVRVLKDLIRGLGANKTEHAIITVSKAASVVNEITSNFDDIVKIKDKGSRHKKKNDKGDLTLLVNILKSLNIWTNIPGRQLSKLSKVAETPFQFDKKLLSIKITDTVARLKLGLPLSFVDDEEDEGHDEV